MMALMTKDGQFDRPEIGDIREDINDIAKQDISPDAPTDDAHLLGQFLGIISDRDDLIFKGLEAVYFSLFVLSSHGDTLDRIGIEEGVLRKPAAPASVELQVDGYPGGFIAANSLFSTDDGVLFETTDDVTFGDITMIDDPDNPGTKIQLQNDNGVGLCRVTVNAMAVDSGIGGNVKAGAITYNADANEDIYAITNVQAAAGGQDAEVDKSYADRIISDRLAGGASSEDGITTAVGNLPDVKQAKLVSNRTMEPDKYGNPAKSDHLYVIGGDDQEVADEYFHVLGVTEYTVGSIAKTVYNLSGDARTIKFDRAKTVPVFIQINITTTDDFDSDNGLADIRTNIKQFFSELKMGETVLFSQIFGQIWNVHGITDIKLAMGTDKTKLALDNVKVDEFELAVTDDDAIEVNVNAG